MQFLFDRARVADAVVDAAHGGVAALHQIGMAHDVEHVAIILIVAKRHHLIGRNPQGTSVIGKRGALARTETDKVRPFGSRRHHVDTVAKEALEILQGRRLIHLGRLEGNFNDVLVDVLGTVDHRHIAVDLIAQMVDDASLPLMV